jgi:uncharacterized protein (DUF305 family)
VPLRRYALVAALLATVALAGCGGGTSEKPNATDAAFVRAMRAHERTIGTIAEIGRRKALRNELRAISKSTLSRRDQQVSALDWFESSLRSRAAPPGAAAIVRGPPPLDARGLRTAVSIDHEFLVLMVREHEYAMATALVERDHGGDRRIKALAQAIYSSSREDLGKLRAWLRTWYGDDTQRGVPPVPPPGGAGGPGPPV